MGTDIRCAKHWKFNSICMFKSHISYLDFISYYRHVNVFALCRLNYLIYSCSLLVITWHLPLNTQRTLYIKERHARKKKQDVLYAKQVNVL